MPARMADRADMDVAEIDMPAVWAFGVAAACELDHGTLKRGRSGWARHGTLSERKDLVRGLFGDFSPTYRP